MNTRYSMAAAGALIVSSGALADQVKLKVMVENLNPGNGAALSPFTVGLHDGSFDPWDAGSAAGKGIQNIAELGDGTVYLQDFAASQPQGVSGVIIATENAFGPGIYLPGGKGEMEFTIDTSDNRFFSFGSMVVPSNDRFVGNDEPIELFDTNGNFVGQTLTLVGGDIWEAKTEQDGLFGAAFIAGQDAMQHIPEGGVIGLNSDFTVYSGVTTPAGYQFTSLPADDAPVARISFMVIPAPGSAGLLTCLALLSARRLRRT